MVKEKRAVFWAEEEVGSHNNDGELQLKKIKKL